MSVGYTEWDKALDIWYLFFGLLATRKFWKEPLARKTAAVLFTWRAAGVATFYFWPHRIVFLLAPSIFENFYLLWTGIRKWWPRLTITTSRWTVILTIATVLKITQEYLMHYRYVDQTWNFFRTYLFWWLY